MGYPLLFVGYYVMKENKGQGKEWSYHSHSEHCLYTPSMLYVLMHSNL